MEHRTQALYTYGCKIKMNKFKVLELINTTYFIYYVICTHKIKQNLEVLLFGLCFWTQFSSLPQTQNILVTVRKLFEIRFDICNFNEKV